MTSPVPPAPAAIVPAVPLKDLASKVPPEVMTVVEKLTSAGHQAVLVGGAVRDLCLGVQPTDYDVATDALPEKVLSLFPHTVATGMQHGTVTVMQLDAQGRHFAVEVTTFRTEGAYADGRRPDRVAFVPDLEADLGRRDFTINALALRLHPSVTLTDPHGGLADLASKVLRTVGPADVRFAEDGLRAVRAARFAAQLHLTPAAGLEDAMRRAVPVVRKVAPERFLQELKKLFEKAQKPSQGLQLLKRTGMLDVMAPLAPTDEASLLRVDGVPASQCTARFAAWLWSAGRTHALATMAGLKASRALQEDAAALCALPFPRALSGASAADLRGVLRSVGKRRAALLAALYRSEDGAGVVQALEHAVAHSYLETAAELALDGTQVQQLSGFQGKALGLLLRALLLRVDQDPSLNTAAALTLLVHQLAAQGPG